MLKVRTTKTASNNTAVQIVRRYNHKTKIIKHIGTARNSQELKVLLELAEKYIIEKSNIVPLFPEFFEKKYQKYNLVAVENLSFTRTYHNFAYEFLSYFYELNGFEKLNNNLLKDLSILRIIEPSSKLRAVELIEKYFKIKYTRNIVYKGLRKIRVLKQDAEKEALEYAKNNLNFDFSIVFYDVTTLYFETFEDDIFRKCGFSKDNKANQPQILIALVVNRDGYPIKADIFEGNKFEGHTFIPVILNLKENYRIKNLTVVADAAMLKLDNLREIEKHELNYIVAARLSSLSNDLLKEIAKTLNKKEGIYFKTETEYGTLICDYSEKRATKDKSDRKKQLLKAEYQIQNTTKATKKLRFVKEITKSKYVINQKLIEKDEMLDGIKGYYTNLKNVEENLIVSRYKDLWIIEKSFRIVKSDLEARPIFHHKRESIEAHILIVFVSLCLSKSIELLTNLSIKRVKEIIWDILDIEFVDALTNKKYLRRMDTVSNSMIVFLENLRKSKRVLKG